MKNQPTIRDYVDFTYFTDTLAKLYSPLISTLNFFATETSSKSANVSRPFGYRNTARGRNKQSNRLKNQPHCGKCRTSAKILTIDLRKIEGNLSLSAKEKRKLKRILEDIRLEDNHGISYRKSVGETMTKSKRKCTTNLRPNSFEVEDDYVKSNEDSKDSNFKGGETGCHKRLKFNTENELLRKCGCKDIVLPELNPIVQKLPVDHPFPDGSNSDGNRSVFCLSSKHSCSSSRTILRVKPSINIGNMRIKYTNPICLVQYSTSKNSNEDKYSRAALKSHLGEGPCPLVNDPHPEHALKRDATLYDDEEEDYVIAKGTLTDEVLESFKTVKEIRRSLFPNYQSHSNMEIFHRQSSLSALGRSPRPSPTQELEENIIALKELNPKTSSRRLVLPTTPGDNLKQSHWEVESFPSTLHNLEKPVTSKKQDNMARKVRERKTSTLKKLKLCLLKTCFCICFEGVSSQSHEDKYKDNRKSNKFTKVNQMHYIKNNRKVIRTTESNFLNDKTDNK